MKDFQVDSMPLKEFRKFLQFFYKEKDDRIKGSDIYYEGEKIAMVWSKYAGKGIKEDNIMMEIATGFGSKRGLSVTEKKEKAEQIYNELYAKFKHSV